MTGASPIERTTTYPIHKIIPMAKAAIATPLPPDAASSRMPGTRNAIPARNRSRITIFARNRLTALRLPYQKRSFIRVVPVMVAFFAMPTAPASKNVRISALPIIRMMSKTMKAMKNGTTN